MPGHSKPSPAQLWQTFSALQYQVTQHEIKWIFTLTAEWLAKRYGY
jgi:hypothetical protein